MGWSQHSKCYLLTPMVGAGGWGASSFFIDAGESRWGCPLHWSTCQKGPLPTGMGSASCPSHPMYPIHQGHCALRDSSAIQKDDREDAEVHVLSGHLWSHGFLTPDGQEMDGEGRLTRRTGSGQRTGIAWPTLEDWQVSKPQEILLSINF